MDINELMIPETSVFADTEFGALDYVEVNGKLYFPASDCAKVLAITIPARRSSTTAMNRSS